LFGDVRLMNNPQAGGVGILGGECFGGSFGRADADGNYYFQGGGIEYRVYRVEGLRQTKRSSGALTVTPEQAAAAELNVSRTLAATAVPRKVQIPYRAKFGPALPKTPEVQWERQGQFPVAISAAHDGQALYLRYTVRGDASPWINKARTGSNCSRPASTSNSAPTRPPTHPARGRPKAICACSSRRSKE
jgi:hypothetical protein